MSDQNESNEQTVSSEQPVSGEQPVEQESKPAEKVQKQKNPKRVEAGNKGAAARWAKPSANLEKPGKQESEKQDTEKQDTEKQSIEKQDQPIHKITRDAESPRDTQPHITVYKNYIPLCFLGLLG